jgi:mannose/fructose/N-acetylgalactosamine-specific phosphotransferase system component IID
MQQGASDPNVMKGLNRGMLPRSFFLETLWNYEKMQNVGFVFCIFPALKRLYPDGKELGSAVERQLSLVNTNPVMGPLLVGITARLENDQASSDVIIYRKRAMAALAAYGDHVFWGHIKPLAAVCGIVLSLLFLGSMVGSAALLVIYNVPNLLVRGLGFSKGWSKGVQTFQLLKASRVDFLVSGLRIAVALALGVAAGLLIVGAVKSPDLVARNTLDVVVGASLPVVTVIGFVLLKRGISITTVIYILSLATVAVLMLIDFGIAVL